MLKEFERKLTVHDRCYIFKRLNLSYTQRADFGNSAGIVSGTFLPTDDKDGTLSVTIKESLDKVSNQVEANVKSIEITEKVISKGLLENEDASLVISRDNIDEYSIREPYVPDEITFNPHAKPLNDDSREALKNTLTAISKSRLVSIW